LVQKLYTNDFDKQFSNYMHNTYPWRYANLFINKNLTTLKVYALISLTALLLFILSFSLFNNKEKHI